MKKSVFACAGALALAGLAAPQAVQAENYDTDLFDLMFDCAALEVIFAQNADDKDTKTLDQNLAISFAANAADMAGKKFEEVQDELPTRMKQLNAMLSANKNDELSQLTRSCAYMARVGKQIDGK